LIELNQEVEGERKRVVLYNISNSDVVLYKSARRNCCLLLLGLLLGLGLDHALALELLEGAGGAGGLESLELLLLGGDGAGGLVEVLALDGDDLLVRVLDRVGL